MANSRQQGRSSPPAAPVSKPGPASLGCPPTTLVPWPPAPPLAPPGRPPDHHAAAAAPTTARRRTDARWRLNAWRRRRRWRWRWRRRRWRWMAGATSRLTTGKARRGGLGRDRAVVDDRRCNVRRCGCRPFHALNHKPAQPTCLVHLSSAISRGVFPNRSQRSIVVQGRNPGRGLAINERERNESDFSVSSCCSR